METKFVRIKKCWDAEFASCGLTRRLFFNLVHFYCGLSEICLSLSLINAQNEQTNKQTKKKNTNLMVFFSSPSSNFTIFKFSLAICIMLKLDKHEREEVQDTIVYL